MVEIPQPTPDQRAYLDQVGLSPKPIDMSIVIGGPKASGLSRMTLSQQAPSLVERLNYAFKFSHESTPNWIVRWRAEREEAAARITKLEDENEQLRLAICGGEDAPGYAASLALATILQVQADHFQTMRRDSEMAWDGETATSWRSRAERAEARITELEQKLQATDAAWDDDIRLLTASTARAERAEAQCRVLLEALGEIADESDAEINPRIALEGCKQIARQALEKGSLPESPSADARSHDDQQSDGEGA